MRKKGFTLMELLIVIAIAAIIAGAMVPMFNVTRRDAKNAKASSEVDMIRAASYMLHRDTGKWPMTGTAGADLLSDASSFLDWAGPYIDTWHSDPWGSTYEIFDVASSRYVQSRGANGIDETPGDDVEVFMTVNP